ncbi:MAG: exo-alpha-sialidase [Planctomycetes bacterium]|nr:exo-alpha-sialidase [Planctomycetota bacterium]
MKTAFAATLLLSFPATLLIAEEPWVIQSAADWRKTEASAEGIAVEDDSVVLDRVTEGQWTSKWHAWQGTVDSADVVVDAEIDLFDNKTIEVLVEGSKRPYTDGDQVPHDWYARCMIAIVDEHRWIMALRSGVNHIRWGDRDTIHLITSTNEGRTWSELNRWFDGTPIEGMPYEDGHTHSEPGLFRMPNGDLILQFWRTSYASGTKQLRSKDDGKTWTLDIDRISVDGVPGADDDLAIGTEDYFVDPENPSHVYMAFQYFHFNSQAGTLLARSRDNCKSYSFMSWMGPLADQGDPDGGATFEPAIEYVGQRTIVAVMRDAAGNRRTWQTVSTNMGASFETPVDVSDKIKGGISNGSWQRARLYKESNPYFQHLTPLDYALGEGRLWGFGLHSMGGGYTRKPVVYWSDDHGESWHGPELLHGPMHPGTDTGYGDLKRRVDGTFVAATYYCQPRDSSEADLEQYTFGGERARFMIEVDRDGDGSPDASSPWREIYNGRSVFVQSSLSAPRWRSRLNLRSSKPTESAKIRRLTISPRKSG